MVDDLSGASERVGQAEQIGRRPVAEAVPKGSEGSCAVAGDSRPLGPVIGRNTAEGLAGGTDSGGAVAPGGRRYRRFLAPSADRLPGPVGSLMLDRFPAGLQGREGEITGELPAAEPQRVPAAVSVMDTE